MIDGATTILAVQCCSCMYCVTSSFTMSSLAPGPAGLIMDTWDVLAIAGKVCTLCT